jgi:hypothetical protein
MLADAHALDVIQLGLTAMLGDLRIAAAAGEHPDVLEFVEVAVRAARDHVAELVSAVTWSMQRYSEAEAAAEQTAIGAGAVLGFGAGVALSGWLLAVLGPLGAPLAGLALPWIAREATASDDPIGPDDVTMPDDVTRVLCDPTVVATIRVGVSSADEAVLGFGGLPALSEVALAAAGITGVNASAYLLAAYGSNAGLFAETPVGLTRTQSSTAQATSGFDARLSKIPLPETAPGGAQIRIDTVLSDSAPPRFEVYIGGTVDFRGLPAEDAFDLTSNVTGVAGLPAGSLRAVQQAMEQAGVTATSQITLTGYSQGGMVAAALAASGDYNVQGVVTVAAPAGNVQLPSGIPAVIVEHTDDFIPALGGVQTNTEALVVQRRAFEPGELPAGLAAPAHRMQFYRETAIIMDQGTSPQLVDLRRRLDAFSAGADSVVSSYYYASRG